VHIKKDELQATLNVLVQLHEHSPSLRNIRDMGGLQHENISQGAIGGTIRLLMKIRDGRKEVR
jgi:hypothetical protein